MPNSYLELARVVLDQSDEPLNAKDILSIAYKLQIVPEWLYGRTQYKTLHARLAEDIKNSRSRSEFMRAAPGRFLLRKKALSGGVHEYFAPLRIDQLKSYEVLCLDRSVHRGLTNGQIKTFGEWDRSVETFRVLSEAIDNDSLLVVRLFVILKCGEAVLNHRSPNLFGDPIDGKLSTGFIGFLRRDDNDLFSADNYGFESAAIRILNEKLYLGGEAFDQLDFVCPDGGVRYLYDAEIEHSLAAVLAFECRPSSKLENILSNIDGAFWRLPDSAFNNVDDLDHWSQLFVDLSNG